MKKKPHEKVHNHHEKAFKEPSLTTTTKCTKPGHTCGKPVKKASNGSAHLSGQCHKKGHPCHSVGKAKKQHIKSNCNRWKAHNPTSCEGVGGIPGSCGKNSGGHHATHIKHKSGQKGKSGVHSDHGFGKAKDKKTKEQGGFESYSGGVHKNDESDMNESGVGGFPKKIKNKGYHGGGFGQSFGTQLGQEGNDKVTEYSQENELKQYTGSGFGGYSDQSGEKGYLEGGFGYYVGEEAGINQGGELGEYPEENESMGYQVGGFSGSSKKGTIKDYYGGGFGHYVGGDLLKGQDGEVIEYVQENGAKGYTNGGSGTQHPSGGGYVTSGNSGGDTSETLPGSSEDYGSKIPEVHNVGSFGGKNIASGGDQPQNMVPSTTAPLGTILCCVSAYFRLPFHTIMFNPSDI